MAEDMTPQAGTDAQPQAGSAAATGNVSTQDVEDVNALPGWAQKIIGELRKESASHRKAKVDAERQAQTAAETAAKEQGKWQELAQQYEPKAKRADALEAFLAELLEDELKSIPDKLRGIVPAFGDPKETFDWVRKAKAAGVLAAPRAPNTDAATATGDKTASNAAAATQRERELWQTLGLTHALRATQGNSK